MKWHNESNPWRERHFAVVSTVLLVLALIFAFTGAAEAADRTPADTGSGVEQVEEASPGTGDPELGTQAQILSTQVQMLRGVLGDDLYLYPAPTATLLRPPAQLSSASDAFRHGRILTE